MKLTFKVLLILLMALMLAVSALAQDETLTPTDEPTAAATPTREVATFTPEPEATAVEIDINVDVTDGTDGTGTGGGTSDAATVTSLALIERLGYWLVIIAMGFIIYTSNKSLREMVSVDTVKALYKDAQGVVGRVTEVIPGKIDDAVAEAILNRVKDYLDKYYAPPPVETTGAVTVNVNPDTSQPAS